MKEKFIVYGLFDPRDGELRYVGQTSRGKDRYWEHIRKREVHRRTHLGHWLKSLDKDGLAPVFGCIQGFATAEPLGDAEIYWISYFKGLGCRLTNSSTGGLNGARGVVMRPETRAKIAAIHTGMKASVQARQNMSAAGVARTRPLLGIPRPKAVREKMSATLQVSWADPETRTRRLIARGCQWVQDQYGATFASINEAASFHGVNCGSVHHVLAGKHSHAGGISFHFVEASP